MEEQGRRSRVRVYLWAHCLIGWTVILFMVLTPDVMVRNILFFVGAVFAIHIWFLKCEKCKAPFYSQTGKEGELPKFTLNAMLFPPKACPRCGVERI